MSGIKIPAFSLYQWQIPAPLKGNWRRRPTLLDGKDQGDRFLNAEIDWLSGTTNTALQFQCGGNSPVALAQIVALYVDNRRCGSDVDFIFPDTAFILTVPAHEQGLYPVLTNALDFYASGANVASGDITIVQILNSLPPPISILPVSEQTTAAVNGIDLTASASTAIVASTISGSLKGISITGVLAGGSSPAIQQSLLSLKDGATPANVLWDGEFDVAASGVTVINVQLTGLNVRFFKGINAAVTPALGAGAGGFVVVNVYYTTP